MMRVVPVLLILLSAVPARAQPVHYEIAFPDAVHREARVTIEWTGLPAGPLQVRMSRARGTGDRPVSIRFRVPEGSGWNVATQLRPTDDPFVFTAPHFQYFMDSPTELADFGLRTYTFIACYMPWVAGDGMEHRNSTILTSTTPLARPLGPLGPLSHEFFHAWNVERLRPRTLEPFDFETLAEVSGDAVFADDFFRRYIEGRDVPDFAALFERAGYLLRRAAPDRGVSAPSRRTPVTVEYRSRGATRSVRVALMADERIELVPFEDAGRTVTDAMRALRTDWLSTKVR